MQTRCLAPEIASLSILSISNLFTVVNWDKNKNSKILQELLQMDIE